MDKALLNVTISQITVFFKVAETNSFSIAAMDLYISQPTVSKIISKMEEEFGFRLFDRTTRKLKMTKEGMYLYRIWKPQMENISQGFNMAKTLQEGSCLSVGLVDTATENSYFPPLRREFEEENPNIVLFEEKRTLSELAYKLDEGYYDLILLPDFERYTLDGMGFPWVWAMRSPAKVVMLTTNRKSKQTEIELKDIIDETIVDCHNKSPRNYEEDLKERFKKYHAAPKVRHFDSKGGSKCSLLENAHEILFIDEYCVYKTDREVVEIPVKDEYNGIICAWNKDNINAAVQKFLEIL